MFRKNNSFLARLPRISANSNENYRPYNFQALANISRFSGRFPEILNFQKLLNPSQELSGAMWLIKVDLKYSYTELKYVGRPKKLMY